MQLVVRGDLANATTGTETTTPIPVIDSTEPAEKHGGVRYHAVTRTLWLDRRERLRRWRLGPTFSWAGDGDGDSDGDGYGDGYDYVTVTGGGDGDGGGYGYGYGDGYRWRLR